MFPLKTRKIGGYKFGQKTWYTAHHLGVDYSAKLGTKLFAPFNGKIVQVLIGKQGGKTIWFKPDNDNVIIRFMHLSEFKVKTGDKVKEGDLIALTGNTGSATTGPHLHLDISKKTVQLSNFANFLDPEKYQWEPKKEAEEILMTLEVPIERPAPLPIEQPKFYDLILNYLRGKLK